MHGAAGLAVALIFLWARAVAGPGAGTDAIRITRPAPDPRGGQAYRLAYVVDVPLDVYWRFKTDFDNAFLESNPAISSHRVVSRQGNAVITEDRYSLMPNLYFRWRTTVSPRDHRLDYELIDTNQPGSKFQYGSILVQADGDETRITQTAYFDFWGASLWAGYPWQGGMRAFLRESAQWEQRTVVRLRKQFESPRKN